VRGPSSRTATKSFSTPMASGPALVVRDSSPAAPIPRHDADIPSAMCMRTGADPQWYMKTPGYLAVRHAGLPVEVAAIIDLPQGGISAGVRPRINGVEACRSARAWTSASPGSTHEEPLDRSAPVSMNARNRQVSRTRCLDEFSRSPPTQQNVGFAIDWFHSRATVSAIHRAVPIGG